MARHRFVICIDNSGYEASLEPRKLYEVLPDPVLAEHGQIRVIDESGEDYVYPEAMFVRVSLPETIMHRILPAA